MSYFPFPGRSPLAEDFEPDIFGIPQQLIEKPYIFFYLKTSQGRHGD